MNLRQSTFLLAISSWDYRGGAVSAGVHCLSVNEDTLGNLDHLKLNNMRDLGMEDKRRESHWYALYTRPRVEKRVTSILEEKQIRAFLPTRSVLRQWSDRKKVVEEPLFPSYVFVFADLAERYCSLQSTGVVRMVQFNGKPAQIPEEQIETIYRILDGGYDPEPHQYLREGDEVEIVAGPLRGIKGYFLESRGNERLIVSVHSLQQSLAIKLRRNQIKKSSSKNILVRNTAPHIN